MKSELRREVTLQCPLGLPHHCVANAITMKEDYDRDEKTERNRKQEEKGCFIA